MHTNGKTILESYGLNKKYTEELAFDIEHLKCIRERHINKFGKSDLIDYELQQKTDAYRQVRNQIKAIESTIDMLEQPSKNILYYKYIKHMQNANIALRMSYSEPRIYQLLNKAITDFEEHYSVDRQQQTHSEQDYSKL